MGTPAAYAQDVGRPKKPEGEKYATPPRSFRPPPELYDRVKAKASARGDKVTAILVRALEAYDKENP